MGGLTETDEPTDEHKDRMSGMTPEWRGGLTEPDGQTGEQKDIMSGRTDE